MKKYLLAFVFGLEAGNVLAADPAQASDTDLTIVFVFGVLVLVLIAVVAWVAFRFARTFKRMIAEEETVATSGRVQQVVSPNVGRNSAIVIGTLIKRITWVSYGVGSTVVLLATSLIFMNAETNAPSLASVPSPIVEKEEPFAPSIDATVIAKGKQVFMGTCSACHREDGGGNTIGPNLTDEYWLHGGRPDSVLHTIRKGFAQKGMPAWETALKPDDVKAVASYVISLHGSQPKDAKAPQGEKYLVEGE